MIAFLALPFRRHRCLSISFFGNHRLQNIALLQLFLFGLLLSQKNFFCPFNFSLLIKLK